MSVSTSPIDSEPAASGVDDAVSISRRELESLRDHASRAEAAATARDEERQRLDAERDRRAADLERSYKAAVRDRELATALAGRPLVPGAAAQLIKLWRDDYDVFEVDGDYRVAARDGRSIGRAIADRLAEAEYAHFCLPTSRGGAPSPGPTRGTGPLAPAAPKTLGEAAIQQWREAASARSTAGQSTVGLRRR